SAAVLDHHLLTPGLGEPVADDAGDHVGGAARDKRNDDAYVTAGPALRACRAYARAGCQRRRNDKPGETAAGEHWLVLPKTLAFVIAGEGARAHSRVSIFQERLLPRGGSHNGPSALWQRA